MELGEVETVVAPSLPPPQCSETGDIDGSISHQSSENQEDEEIIKELRELEERWSRIRWDRYKGSKRKFSMFWEEDTVKNVRIAVKKEFFSRNFAASLLGIKNPKKFSHDQIIVSEEIEPVIAQDFINLWGVLTIDQYKERGETATQFWKESFVRKVLFAASKDHLTVKGAAYLLGVEKSKILAWFKKMFGRTMHKRVERVKKVEALDESNEVDKESLFEPEGVNENWWEMIVPNEMDVDISDEKRDEMWILFLQYSQIEIKAKKAKFNPYKAKKQEVADFLNFVHTKQLWPEFSHPDQCLATFLVYLPELALPSSVSDLMIHHKPSEVKNIWYFKTPSPISPYNSTWSNFCQYCGKIGQNPFLAEPEIVGRFLISRFQGIEMRLEEVLPKENPSHFSSLEKEHFFRPAYDFYRDNLARLLSELDWHLQHSWLTGSLTCCEELELLKKAVISCDERLLTDMLDLKDLVLKISPNYSYSKVRTNYSGEKFWERKFTKNILNDVRNKAIPVSVAANGLGVTSEMIYYAIEKDNYTFERYDQDNPTGAISVIGYVFLGYGNKGQFWEEQSNLDLLQDVRNRNVSVEKVAALTGVSRKEVLERCGGVKTEHEREAEKELEMCEKENQKRMKVKKKSPLEIQIEVAEKNTANSIYEEMRLKNMKERLALLKSLDFDKEKNEISALMPKNKPRKVKEVVQLRGKSVRIKRLSQVDHLKNLITTKDWTKYDWTMLQVNRRSPNYFGHWTPRSNKNVQRYVTAVTEVDVQDEYDEKAIAEANHVPKFELNAQELLEITPSYLKSRTLLESFSADFKQVKVEKQPLLARDIDWNTVEMVQDNMISTDNITSLDSCEEFICFGTESGGVGVTMAGRAFTIKPHNRQVTRTIFTGSKGSPSILSSSKDGTVRIFDLVKQSVSLQYCWDQSSSDKQGVDWVEERGAHLYILDCGDEINMTDTRTGELFHLFAVPQSYPLKTTNLSVNRNLMSVCRGNTVHIRDLRKLSEPLTTLTGPDDTVMAGAGWSRAGSYFYSCTEGGYKDMTKVYSTKDYSQPILEWVGSRETNFPSPTGVTWCPWGRMFIISMKLNNSDKEYLKQSPGLAVVDCVSGDVIGEISEGLDNSNYLVHCSKSRQMMVVANNNGPGGLAVFKVA